MKYTFKFSLFGKRFKCYGSDSWGQDVQSDWNEI